MHKNKDKIMKLLSCLVVIAILTSAVPILASTPKTLKNDITESTVFGSIAGSDSTDKFVFISTAQSSNIKGYWFNSDTNTFIQIGGDIPSSGDVVDYEVADVNGDEIEEILVLGDSKSIFLYKWNNWIQEFTKLDLELDGSGWSGIPVALDVADVDENGVSEVFIACTGGSAFSDKVYSYECDTTLKNFQLKGELSWSGEIFDIFSGDGFNDGSMQLMVVGWSPQLLVRVAHLRIYEWDGSDYRNTYTITDEYGFQTGTVGDSDNDGKDEIVMCTQNQKMCLEKVQAGHSPKVVALDYDSTKDKFISKQIDTLIQSVFYPDYKIHSVDIGDADNDGSNEVVIGIGSLDVDGQVYLYEYQEEYQKDSEIDPYPEEPVLSVDICNLFGNNQVVITGTEAPNLPFALPGSSVAGVFQRSDSSWIKKHVIASYFLSDIKKIHCATIAELVEMTIAATPEKNWYDLGEFAKVTIDVTNNRGRDTEIWLGTTFKGPEGNEYDLPLKHAEILKGETKSFNVDWTIPTDALLGQYELAVNCWKDSNCNEKHTDDLEWVPIFNIVSTVDKGLDWLRTQQKTDGDHVYWTYQGTPNVGVTALVTLAFLNHGYDESDPTVKGALNWLVAQANDADGSISYGDLKVYDTSLAILPLVAAQNEAKYGDVRTNARNYLISVQNNEANGYDHSDRFYGGWGYPKDNWADLSNTQFVVMALDAAGGLTGEVKDNALTFVTRCQNRKESNADYSSYDDGGFIYQPKSGGTSYGSMTAAGLWGLFLCGVGKNDGRVQDALGWLDADERSVEQNDPIGNKWVYYYDLGLAKAYLMAEAKGCKFEKTDWYEDLYAFLSAKQDKKDGHWHNIEGERSCDVLATAEAILALSVKEVPKRISKLSYMVFKLRSAADLHIYDPEGRHVGLNTETGEVEIGIPDATYTENPIEIKIPNLDAGGYKAVLIGTEAGEYELEVIAKTGNKTLAEASYEGWITEGATQEMVTTISSIVGPLDVRLGTLEAVVEEEDSYSEQFSLDAGDELEIDAIDETGVLLRIEAEEECEGEVKIMDYSENPTIKGFPGEYKYCALEKYVDISLDVDKEKIDWPVYLEVHYDEDELPENVDESTLTLYHYLNDTKWRSCNDFEVNLEENYISAELEKDELCYFGMGGLYAPFWTRYSMLLIVIAILIVVAVGYFSVRRFVKSRRVKAMKVPERVPAEVAITIYNFDNSFSLLKEREETAKILDGLDGRLASGEIKEETYNDLNSKYESKIGELNRKIKSELERAKAYLQRIEDERTKLQRTHESLNAELQKEKGRKKKAEISAKVAEISAEIESVEGIVKTMKEKIGVIEGEFSGD